MEKTSQEKSIITDYHLTLKDHYHTHIAREKIVLQGKRCNTRTKCFEHWISKFGVPKVLVEN